MNNFTTKELQLKNGLEFFRYVTYNRQNNSYWVPWQIVMKLLIAYAGCENPNLVKRHIKNSLNLKEGRRYSTENGCERVIPEYSFSPEGIKLISKLADLSKQAKPLDTLYKSVEGINYSYQDTIMLAFKENFDYVKDQKKFLPWIVVFMPFAHLHIPLILIKHCLLEHCNVLQTRQGSVQTAGIISHVLSVKGRLLYQGNVRGLDYNPPPYPDQPSFDKPSEGGK